MSLPEVCSVWIDQRIEEERGIGKSLREIGRIIAEEVARHFEVQINPETIKSRIIRSGSNEPLRENDEESITSTKLEKLEKTHGGAREGSGRKPKDNPGRSDQKEVKREDKTAQYMRERETMSKDFQEACDNLMWQIKYAKEDGWSSTTKLAAISMLDMLKSLIA